MFTRRIKAGATDVSVVLRVIDSTDGTPETGVDHATTGLDLKYRREGAANVDITEAALAALTTAHTDGGVEQIGNGYIRVDLPDAACAAGVSGVMVHGVATDMVIIGCYIELVAHDPFNAGNADSLTQVGDLSLDTDIATAVETQLADDLAPTYQAKAWLFDDNGGTTDRYVVTWFRNAQPHFTGITSPTIQVIKAADGTDLVASTAMTEIGSTGMYRYNEGTNRIINGVAYILKVTASIDAATRTWVQPIGRDS